MPEMLSIYLTSKDRGHFCGYIQALNYHKNSRGLLSVRMFGIPDSVIMDREYEDITELIINEEIITPEEL